MLSKRQRYPLRQDREFFTTAKRFSHPFFVVFWKKKPGDAQAACIVPKTVFKKAIDRNKAKRWIAQTLSSILIANPGNIFVVLVKKKFEFKDTSELGDFLVKVTREKHAKNI